MNPVILIAEDVLVNRLLVKSYVTIDFPKSKILEASNGIEAVEETIKNYPEIIFMDLHMPYKNGYQAAQEIREYEKTLTDNKPIIIIALSADTTDGVAAKCRANGMNDYIQKPFKTNDVRAVLKKYFNPGKQQQNVEIIASGNLPAEFKKSDLLERINGNIPLFQKLADIAITQLSSDLEKLTEAILMKDLSAIKMSNHSIKGVGLNLYFSRLAELAKKLEAEYDYNEKHMMDLTNSMKQEFEIIKLELKKDE